MKSIIVICQSVLLSGLTSAASIFSWTAASGLFPDAVAINPSGAVTLGDTSSPEDPVLSGGQLTIANNLQDERMFYNFNLGALALSNGLLSQGFAITANVIVDSGSQFDRRRAPAIMSFNTAGSTKTLHIGTTFASLTTDFEASYPTTTTDNQSTFNTFRMEVGGTSIGSPLRVFKNGVQILTSNTGDQTGAPNSPNIAFNFGESSTIAQGTSRWTSFSIETIPEPSTVLFTLFGASSLLRRKRSVM